MRPTSKQKRQWLVQAYKRIERSGPAADVELIKQVAKSVSGRAIQPRKYQRGDVVQLDEGDASSPHARVLAVGHGLIQVTVEATTVIEWLTSEGM